MKKISNILQSSELWRRLPLLFLGLAGIFALLSITLNSQRSSLNDEGEHLQKVIHKRQAILEEFSYDALDVPVDKWLTFEDFPSDMVIYRYNADTLQSWVNQFPISNDEVDIDLLSYADLYGEHYLDGQNRYISPFAYLTGKEQFINIGNAWYVVKRYSKGENKVVAGLFIKSGQSGQINPKLGLPEHFDLLPITFEDGMIIKGKDGEVLFSLIEDVSVKHSVKINTMIWLALICVFFAVFFFFAQDRTVVGFVIFIASLTLLRFICFELGSYMSGMSEFFSPGLYADSGIFSSIGNLLLNNLYVTSIVLALCILRTRYLKFIRSSSGVVKWFFTVLIVLLPVALFIYIHYTLRSLIYNSSIVMELYRVTELSLYTMLSYLSYALLFLALMLALQIIVALLGMKRKRYLLSRRNTIIYAFCISLYTLLAVSFYSFKEEKVWSRLAANKLYIERDLGLELELRAIEAQLYRDPVYTIILNLSSDNLKTLEQRFSELYFQRIKQKYIINLSICRPNESLQVSQLVVDCNEYFSALLSQYNAVPISERSSFFYLSNFNGRVGYLGVFRYVTDTGPINLYIEIDSRYLDEPIGYPSELSDYQSQDLHFPPDYSYAKYYKRRLVLNSGHYDYPVNEREFASDSLAVHSYEGAHYIQRKDGYVHFINQVLDDSVVVLSRPVRSVFPYIVSFSYLMLFFTAMLYFAIRIRRAHKKAAAALMAPKRSIRGQMTTLITSVLAVSLIAAGTGSVWYSIKYYQTNNRSQMEEKIQTVQKTLAAYCTYVQNYTDINSNDLFQAMDRLASDTRADINIYDPQGRLIRSTKPELFQRYVLSSRMNPKAYYELIYKSRSQVFNKEKAGGYSYNSLYAPIFNYNGKLIAIANIPYFTRNNSSMSGNISSIVATIINVSILLLILAVFLGRMLSARVTKPLAQISTKMKFIDVAQSPEHINYEREDELGSLVESYNKMVDDLAESTKQIAQSERQKAWSDMARRIAHEIKNPLTPMKLSIQRLIVLKEKDATGWQDKFDDIAQSILEQIEILSNTASEFSSFAKFFVEDNSAVNLYEILKEEKALFDTQDNIRIAFGYQSEDCLVYARKGQIIRVVVNLIANAVQALEKIEGKGFIRISLKRQENDYIVSIEDNGNGVSQEDLSKLFTPNFTTKSSGNGLGLAISKSIIDQSGGKIWYSKSELGGANFSFSLPCYDSFKLS